MAKITFMLSKKSQGDSGRNEIVIQLSHQHFNMRAKSGVFVNPSFFDGDIVIRQRLMTPDVIFHKEQKKRLISLKAYISIQFEDAIKCKEPLTKDWLKDTVDKYNNPENYSASAREKRSIHEIINEYVNTPDRKTNQPLAESHTKMYRVLNRAIARYAGYVRETDKNRKDFDFDINKVTREDIEDFSDYLRHESELAADKPRLFDKLTSEYPQGVEMGHRAIEPRGENTVIKMKARLRSIFRYCNTKGYTDNRPFEGVVIGTAKVGTPYYINIEERNQIADADLASVWESMSKAEQQAVRMPYKTLAAQRDIFVFQ